MHMTPLIAPLVGVVFIILLLGLFLKKFRQPQLVAYILTGILIGPNGIGLIGDYTFIDHLGGLGVSLLLFFIGMEISPRQLIVGWRIAILGTLLQILLSVLFSFLLGWWLGWPLARSVLLGFVISLSSTAVVLKLLQDSGEMGTKAGQNVLLILLAQDLAVVPMLIILSLLSTQAPSSTELAVQMTGGSVLILFTLWLVRQDSIRIPFIHHFKRDHEFQVFAALLICFGTAFITGMFNLSAALGAFLAGIIVGTAKETEWVHHALDPLRVILVALFFVSVGMLIQVDFVMQHVGQILLLVLAVLLTNTFINALILRLLGDDFMTSLYSGIMLSQIGEFSFILAAVGVHSQIVSPHAYQLTVAVIAFSLLFSPAWISLARRVLRLREQRLAARLTQDAPGGGD